MSDTTYTCYSCESVFDSDEAPSFSTRDYSNEICEACYSSDLESASKVIVFDFNSGEQISYLIGDYTAIELSNGYEVPDRFTRSYVKTDGWRGYYNTSIDGTVEVGTGADLWGQTTDVRVLADTIAEAHNAGTIIENLIVYAVVDMTSNLFATNITLFVDEDKVELFNNTFTKELENN